MDVWTLALGCAGFILLFLIFAFLTSLKKSYSIKGKHILITGGSSGIGKSIACHALKGGAGTVTLVARNKEKLSAVKEQLELKHRVSDSQSVNVISTDVSDPEVGARITEALSGSSPVDILINSAGITHTADFLGTSNSVFESIIKTNLMGTVQVTRAILPSMIDRQEGCIVLVCSQAGQFPMYGYTAYASSKFALRGFAEVLQMEVRPHNIRVLVSYPPDTETPQLEEEEKQRSPLVKQLAGYGTTLKPEQISTEILNGIERGQFSVSHGFDGFMLKTLTAGASPITSLFDVIVQCFLTPLFRLVALGYLRQFNTIVLRNLKKDN